MEEFALGCIPSPEDERDYLAKDYITMGVRPMTYFPDKIAPILSQGFVGSCVSHTLATVKWYQERRERLSEQEYSTDFTYHNRRSTDHQEKGLIVREGLKNFVEDGTVLKKYLPTNTEYPDATTKTIVVALKGLAKEYKSDKYVRTYDPMELCDSIYQYGAALIAIKDYISFQGFVLRHEDDCMLPMPNTQTEPFLGYHAVTAIGYDTDGLWIQNSHGNLWGWNGIAKIPWDYPITEMWTIVDHKKNWDILSMTVDSKDLYVNGKLSFMDVPPIIVENRTFTPARYVAENLGAKVIWGSKKRTVTIEHPDNISIVMTIGSKTAIVNGTPVNMDVAPFIHNNRTYTPARFVAEYLRADVEYLDKERKVVIRKERKG